MEGRVLFPLERLGRNPALPREQLLNETEQDSLMSLEPDELRRGPEIVGLIAGP